MPYNEHSRASEFLKKEYSRMKSYVRGILADAADRDSGDIVNEVMTRFFERADISAPIEDLAAYLYRSLRNNVIDLLRRKKMSFLSIDDEHSFFFHMAMYTGNGPAQLFEAKELQERINDAIDSLPEELRSVFYMNEIEGKSFSIISEITGIPPGTLMARKARAMELLRNALRNYKNYLED